MEYDDLDNLEFAQEYEFSRFKDMSDAEVAALAAKNDDQALLFLLEKYKNMVRTKARSYFLIGADREDLIQEGMIGLYKAVRDFKAERQVSFRVFAEVCITRQIITAIKTATRQKHKPLNSYVSLNKPIYDEESDRTLSDIVTVMNDLNPEDIMINKEDVEQTEAKIEQMLSDLEWRVLCLYLEGKSYQEIAKKLNRQPKSIDNALQRVKAKIEKYLDEEKEA